MGETVIDPDIDTLPIPLSICIVVVWLDDQVSVALCPLAIDEGVMLRVTAGCTGATARPRPQLLTKADSTSVRANKYLCRITVLRLSG